MVDIKTAIEDICYNISFESRNGRDFCTTEGEVAILLDELKRYRETGLQPEEVLSPEQIATWIKESTNHSSSWASELHRRSQGFSDSTVFVCSRCLRSRNLRSNYCPNCGAKMQEIV